MRTRATFAVIAASVAAFAMATPAAACDMHGAGGYGSPFGMQWKSFSPKVSHMDPALADAAMTPMPKPAKPSFSSAADRASRKALAKRDATEAQKAKPVKKASLETDR